MSGNPYTAVIRRDGRWWIGWVEEVPGVNSQGETREELLANLREALSEAIEMNREDEAEHREILRETLSAEVTRRSFKSFLARMPDTGDDADFAPQRDMPRKISS